MTAVKAQLARYPLVVNHSPTTNSYLTLNKLTDLYPNPIHATNYYYRKNLVSHLRNSPNHSNLNYSTLLHYNHKFINKIPVSKTTLHLHLDNVIRGSLADVESFLTVNAPLLTEVQKEITRMRAVVKKAGQLSNTLSYKNINRAIQLHLSNSLKLSLPNQSPLYQNLPYTRLLQAYADCHNFVKPTYHLFNCMVRGDEYKALVPDKAERCKLFYKLPNINSTACTTMTNYVLKRLDKDKHPDESNALTKPKFKPNNTPKQKLDRLYDLIINRLKFKPERTLYTPLIKLCIACKDLERAESLFNALLPTIKIMGLELRTIQIQILTLKQDRAGVWGIINEMLSSKNAADDVEQEFMLTPEIYKCVYELYPTFDIGSLQGNEEFINIILRSYCIHGDLNAFANAEAALPEEIPIHDNTYELLFVSLALSSAPKEQIEAVLEIMKERNHTPLLTNIEALVFFLESEGKEVEWLVELMDKEWGMVVCKKIRGFVGENKLEASQ